MAALACRTEQGDAAKATAASAATTTATAVAAATHTEADTDPRATALNHVVSAVHVAAMQSIVGVPLETAPRIPAVHFHRWCPACPGGAVLRVVHTDAASRHTHECDECGQFDFCKGPFGSTLQLVRHVLLHWVL